MTREEISRRYLGARVRLKTNYNIISKDVTGRVIKVQHTDLGSEITVRWCIGREQKCNPWNLEIISNKQEFKKWED